MKGIFRRSKEKLTSRHRIALLAASAVLCAHVAEVEKRLASCGVEFYSVLTIPVGPQKRRGVYAVQNYTRLVAKRLDSCRSRVLRRPCAPSST